MFLAAPRGFCAGVVRAVDIVEIALERHGAPVYVKHEIVHNPHVVSDLESQGAVTVETVDEIPEGSVVVFSAHGSPPADYDAAKKRSLNVIDATCPLVHGYTMRPRNTIGKGKGSSWSGIVVIRRSKEQPARATWH